MKVGGNVLLAVSAALVTFGVFTFLYFARSAAAHLHSPAADAASSFRQSCATCHGRDGRGQTRKGRQTHARDLTNAAWQDDVSDERLFNSINNGRGKMPAFKKFYSESDIDALVAHVRRLRR